MTPPEEKYRLILEHERGFADLLAGKVLNKPKISLWMILVPVIFVFHLNDWQTYKESRKAFAANSLITPERALDEAIAVVQSGRLPDVAGLTAKAELTEETRQKLTELSAVLVEHYVGLLQADGSGFEALVRSSYRNLTNYLLFLNLLANAEKALNASLQPGLAETTKEASDIIDIMEQQSSELRRTEAEKIFA